jgi:hypothetical protein
MMRPSQSMTPMFCDDGFQLSSFLELSLAALTARKIEVFASGNSDLATVRISNS